MNKKLILTCLLALNGVVFAAEKKKENKEKMQTEGELLLNVLKHYRTGTLEKDLMFKLWNVSPVNPKKVDGRELWEVQLPANATDAGTSLLTQPKAVATIGHTCTCCPQMKTYKLPVMVVDQKICYTQIMFCGMVSKGKFAVTLDSRSISSDLNYFKSPQTIVFSPGMADAVKKILNITCPCKKLFVLQVAQEKLTASSDAAKA